MTSWLPSWFLACKSAEHFTPVFLHHHHYSTYPAITPTGPERKENCDLVYMRNALPFPNPKQREGRKPNEQQRNNTTKLAGVEGPTIESSPSEEAVVVEHEAAGGVGAEQLVVRRPRLRPEPHPPERLQDLAPVHAPGHHHLLDARLHLNPLDACD